MKEIISTCFYCAQACRLRYLVDNGKIRKVLPLENDPVSRGKPCIKGLTIAEVVDKKRILYPMIRKSGRLERISWPKALNILARKLKEFSASEIFFGASGKITNEDNFVIQKFARLAFASNNVDGCCARLCHAATVMGFKNTLGIGASPGYFDDILNLDCLLIIGSNPASNHPVSFRRILKMKEKGGKIIVVSPIVSETAEVADLHLSIAPGSESAFLLSLIFLLIKKKKYSKEAEKFENFQKLKEAARKYPPEVVAKISKTDAEKIEKAAQIIGEASNFGVMHGMGLTQHVNGIENVHLLVDLALLKEGKVVSGRGEINVQGCGDMSTGPSLLEFSKQIDLENLKKIWKKDLPHSRGMNLIEAIALGQAKMVLITNFNPAQSMPDLKRIHKNLKKIFLVQMDSYFNLTSRFADLILPVPILIEREGTITNGERRVRKVSPVRKPIGEALPEWKIYSRLAKRLKVKGFTYQNSKEILQEIVRVIKDYQKIKVEKIWQGNDFFASKEIKWKRFVPEEFEGIEEIRSKDYPFILFTFRSPYDFLTNEAIENSSTLKKMGEGAVFFLNQKDAKNLGLKKGEKIKVLSKVGKISGPVKISPRILPGFIGANFHHRKLLVNKLFPLQFDEESFTPNFKVVAVRAEKLLRGR